MGGDQLPGPSQGGSGDASCPGDPIIWDDQSLFSDTEFSCLQSSESTSVSFSGALQPSLQNWMNFPNLAQIIERYQISNTVPAALANAVQYILAYPALDYPAPRLTGRVQQADTFYIIM